MNQIKTGKFIAKLRKEKNMTQGELAEKMEVSINAVSKWERGLSFPDVSLYKKLCNELGINIEELINGEKDNSDEAKEKAIITTINESKRVKRNSKKLMISLLILFVLILSGIIYYNLKLKVNLVSDSDYLYEEVINFLKDRKTMGNPDSKKYRDFNIFFSYHGFGIEKKISYKYVYMWVYETSYYIEPEEYGSSLAISSGSSMPIKAIFKDNKLQDIIYPKDGNQYTSSIKEMFPGIIAYQVLHFDNEKNINSLFNEVEQKKNIYYDYLTLDMSKVTMDDVAYDNIIFSIRKKNGNCDIPVELSILKNNKYILYTGYKTCRPGKTCDLALNYNKYIEGTYDYDVMEIIKHSIDADLHQYTNDNLPEFMIHSGKGHEFITDSDNKYLKEFLKSINVNLSQCAKANYGD